MLSSSSLKRRSALNSSTLGKLTSKDSKTFLPVSDFIELEKLNIDDMTNYAVIVRYDDIIEPNLEDAKEAIAIAEKTKLFTLKKINIQ